MAVIFVNLTKMHKINELPRNFLQYSTSFSKMQTIQKYGLNILKNLTVLKGNLITKTMMETGIPM